MLPKLHVTIIFAVLTVCVPFVCVRASEIATLRSVNGHLCSAGELLIKFREGVSAQSADTVHRDLKVKGWKRGYNNNYQIMSFEPDRESEMIEAYKKRTEVAYAEPNYYATVCAVPNDAYYPLQWNFSQINLPDARHEKK